MSGIRNIKKSTIPGYAPTSLQVGEILINIADNLVFSRDDSGSIVSAPLNFDPTTKADVATAALADASNLGGRLGATALAVPNDDWNDAVESGFYKGTNKANQPVAGVISFLGWTIADTGTYGVQFATDYNASKKLYARTLSAGVWGAWNQVTAANWATFNADNPQADENLYMSTGSPSGGSDGDVWFQYE